MTRIRKSTPEMEQLLYDETAEVRKRVRAIDLVATDCLFDHEPQLRRLIEHEAEEIRAKAINSLISIWRREDLFERAYSMMRQDLSSIVRDKAASAFGIWLARRGIGHPRRDEVLRQLAEALREEEHELIQLSLYGDLREAITGKKDDLPGDFEFVRDVDWEMLKPYLPDTK